MGSQYAEEYYWLIRESDSKEAMLIYKGSNLWWRDVERVEEITQAQYETYAEFGIPMAATLEEVHVKMRLK